VNNVPNSGCTDITFWNCINEGVADLNGTFVALDPGSSTDKYAASFGLGNQRWSNFLNYSADVWCKWTSNPGWAGSQYGGTGNFPLNISISYYSDDWGGTYVLMVGFKYKLCPIGEWGRVTITNDNSGGYWGAPFPPTNNNALVIMDIGVFAPVGSLSYNASLYISTIKMTGFFQTTVGCNGGDWWANAVCTVYSVPIVGDLVKFLAFIYNIIITLGGWLWFGMQYSANLFAIIGWLFFIPSMPSPIQLFVDAILLSWIGIIGVEVYKLLKPFGGD
jgi:hypothetical protein